MRWKKVFLTGLLALGLVSGCSERTRDPQAQKIQALRQDLKANPADAAAHYQLGLLLHDEGEYEEALQHFQAATQDPEFKINAQFQGAILDYERGDYDQAIAGLEAIKRDNPEFPFPDIHYYLGRIHLREGRNTDAVKSLRKAIDLGYDHSRVFFLLGDTLFRQGNYAEAIDYFRIYLERDADQPIVRLYLGKSLDNLGRSEEAREVYRSLKQNVPWLRQANLTVLENYRIHEEGEWVVRGVIKNLSIIKLLDVNVKVSLWSFDDRITNETTDVVYPRNLYPSQEGSFEFRFPYSKDVKRHEVKGLGRIPQQSLENQIEWLDKVS